MSRNKQGKVTEGHQPLPASWKASEEISRDKFTQEIYGERFVTSVAPRWSQSGRQRWVEGNPEQMSGSGLLVWIKPINDLGLDYQWQTRMCEEFYGGPEGSPAVGKKPISEPDVADRSRYAIVWIRLKPSPTLAGGADCPTVGRPNGNWVSITKCLSSGYSKGQGQPHTLGAHKRPSIEVAGHIIAGVNDPTRVAAWPRQLLLLLWSCQAISKHMEQLATHQTVKWTADYGGLNVSTDVLPLNGMGPILITHPTQLP